MGSQVPESRTFARIRRAYVGTALMVFNTALFGCVLLGAVHVGLDLVEWYRGPTPVYSPMFDLSAFTIADESTAREIVLEFDEHAFGGRGFAGEGEYDYQPWAGFAERPFSGKYLNVEERRGYTVRRTSAPDPPRGGVRDLVVWAFGGSTMFGFGMNDDQTVASHLQRELQALSPERRVVVVNHGHGWWYSSQEVVHFLALLRIETPPDVAVFLDGFNDCFITFTGREPVYFTSVLRDGWEAERQRRRYPAPGGAWAQLTASFPLVRLNRVLRPLGSGPPPVPERFRMVARDPIERILQLHRANRRIAGAVAQAFGIQAHFFLQPKSDEAGSWLVHLPAAYPAWIEEARAAGDPLFVSLQDSLDGLKRAYIDTIHYNEEASRVLAARMARWVVDHAHRRNR